MARWVALADIMRPHGISGELRLRLYNAESELLQSASQVLVRERSGAETKRAVEWMRPAAAGHLLAKLEGVESREAAGALRGGVVCMDRDAFAALEENEFYACDVVGALLVGPEGELGTVEALQSYPSADVLLVRSEKDKKRVEIPLVDDFVDRVDVARKMILVRSAALQFFE